MATTDIKPTLSSLQTPVSATYPSELKSPLAGTPTWIKQEEGQRTPITPPVAYLDFLKNLSPALISPVQTGTKSHFSYHERPSANFERATSTSSVTSTSSSTVSAVHTIHSDRSSPVNNSHPPSRTSSRNSNDAEKTPQQPDHKRPPPSRENSTDSAKQDMKISIPPPSPYPVAPQHRPGAHRSPLSARTPRLRIQSPYSPAGVRSPLSAGVQSIRSPYSATSPTEHDYNNGSRAVSVRQVVTRTVTYTKTPIEGSFQYPAPPTVEPAPKGKRRKVE